MYCLHNPGDKHVKWQENKDARKASYAKKNGSDTTPTTSKTYDVAAKTDTDAAAKKLSLSQKLSATLCTQAGVFEDRFKKISDECCSDP